MQEQQKLVLIVDDNEDDYKIISRNISDKYVTEYCGEQTHLVNYIIKSNPECILLDYHLGPSEGIKVLQKIKSTEKIKRIPVIMMTGEQNPDVIIDCMKNNAQDYLIKGSYGQERIIKAIEQSIEKANLELKIEEQQKLILKLSRTDELTGVFSRRYLLEKMKEEILRSNRSREIFSVTIVDLDSFKNINDEYGHLTGDVVLKEMTKIIKKGIRNTDYVGRFGGDEFIIVLLDFEKNGAIDIIQNHGNILNKIRKNITDSVIIPSPKEVLKSSRDINKGTQIKKPIHFSATFGYTLFNDSITAASDLLANADQALYKAKEHGKNCVACYNRGKITFIDKEIKE